MFKKLLKIGLICFAVFVVLLTTAVIVLKVMYPPERIRAMVEPKLTELIKRDAKIKSASLSLFPSLGVKIEGLRLSNTSRTVKVKQPGSLWEFLKQSNLKKKFVDVTINGKPQEDVAEKDVTLKAGDVLKVSRQGFRNKEALFSLGQLLIDVEVMPLFRKKVVIKKIVLDKLNILVEVDRRGSFNFDDLAGPPAKKAKAPKKPEPKKQSQLPISLRLNSFVIKDSKIVYYNRKTQQEVILGDINQTLSVQSNPEMTDVVSKGLLEIKRMTVQGRGIPVRKSGMYFMMRHNLHVDLKAGNLRIDDFAFGLKKTVISAKGAVRGFDKKVKHLDLKISTNQLKLHDLYREVPPAMFPQARKMKVKGTARLNVAVKGKLGGKGSMPAVSGLFQINGAYIKYADLPEAINALNANILFTTNSLNVKKLAFNLGKNPVSLLLKVNNFKKPVVDALLKANVNLATVKNAVKLPKGVNMQGTILANVSAKGKIEPKNPEAITVQGKLALNKVVVNTPAVKKPIQLDGTFLFGNQEITLEKLNAKIGRSAFTANLKIRDYLSLALPKKVKKKTATVSFSLTSPYLNVDEILGSQKGSSGKQGSGNTKTSAGAKSTGDEPISVPQLPDVEVTGKIRVAKLMYADMPINNGSIDLSYKKKKVDFSLGAKLYSGVINESFIVDLSNPKRISVRNKLSGRKMEANDFISKINDVPKDDGKLLTRLKRLDNRIYGQLNLLSNINTHGSTVNELKRNLSGDISSDLRRAIIKNATMLAELTSPLPQLIRPFIPNLTNLQLRKLLLFNLKIKQGRIHITKLSIPLRKVALDAYGSIGLDNTVDMKVDIILDRWTSRKINRQQRRLHKAAGGLIGKIGGGQVGSMVQGRLKGALNMAKIPTDKKGRIIPVIGVGGTVSKLKFYLVGFKGKGGDLTSPDGGSVADSAKKLLKDQVDQVKRRAEQELKKAKQKAMKAAAMAKRKAMQAVNKAKARAMKAANEAKELASKKATQAANEAKKKAQKLQKEASLRAKKETQKLQKQAEKRKKELQKKTKEAAEKAKKGLGGFFGK